MDPRMDSVIRYTPLVLLLGLVAFLFVVAS